MRGFRLTATLFSVAFLLLVGGCAAPDAFGGSRAHAVDWAVQRGFTVTEVDSGSMNLLALVRQIRANETLTVYIEGDGAPWVTPWRAPSDPTPLKPLALALAAADPAPAVAYLGRPCQYPKAGALASCNPAWWMERRFAPEVLEAYASVLSQLQARLGAQRLRLVGYSGGGVIAALLAAQRPDVERLFTVAAPLALNDWATWHELTSFAPASDPSWQPGPFPPAVHWVGQDDSVVPPAIVERFIAKKGGEIVRMPGYDHQCCWARDWAHLVSGAYFE